MVEHCPKILRMVEHCPKILTSEETAVISATP